MKHVDLEKFANGAFMTAIKEYLEYELSDELEKYHITVIA